MWSPKITYTVDLKAYNDSQRIGAPYSFNGFSLASWLIMRSWTFFLISVPCSVLFCSKKLFRCLVLLGHGVQGAAVLEPFNLCLVESLLQLDFERLAILGVNSHDERLSNGELSAGNINLFFLLALTV